MPKNFKKRFKKKKSKALIFKKKFFWYSILSVILFCSFIYFLFFSSVTKVENIEIIADSSAIHLVSPIKEIVHEELEKNFLKAFTKDSFFLADAKQIKQRILQEFPEIQNVSVRKKVFKSLILDIFPREPVGVWCYQKFNECFLIDSKGVVFKSVSTTSDEIKNDLFLMLSGAEIKKEFLEQVIEQDKIGQIILIHKTIKDNLDIELNHFYLSENENLKVITQELWEIRFALGADIALALTKLKLVLEQEITQDKRRNLEYIDLRFKKLFYK